MGIGKQVAMSHVRAEQMKGWFLANAKLILVLLSGMQLFLGVVALSWGDRPAAFDGGLLSVVPAAIIGGLLAVCIEGGTLFSSAFHLEVARKVRQELEILERVKAKLGSDAYDERKRKIEAQKKWPFILMIICVSFSVTGAEIFWQHLFAHSEWYFHIIGAVMGVVCSALLMIFELNTQLVERVIEKSISGSALTHVALQEDARTQIHSAFFDKQTAHLRSPEFQAILSKGAEQNLLGVVLDAVNTAGMSVSVRQLTGMIEEETEARQAAEAYIESGGDAKLLASPSKKAIPIEKKRSSKHRKAVEDLCHKYGVKRVADDMPTYASEIGMDVRTLQRHLGQIASGQ
jgi:hypothetical protein